MKIEESRSQILLIGTLVGAGLGLITSILLAREAEQDNGELNITAGDILRTATTLVGAMRGVASLGKGGGKKA
ncbi:MAG: hypothetical protein ACPG8W_22170 [Candidatus Promineifilaceae bacterium]